MKRNPLKDLPTININHIQHLPHADKKVDIGAYTLGTRALFSALPSCSLGHTRLFHACDVPGIVLDTRDIKMPQSGVPAQQKRITDHCDQLL